MTRKEARDAAFKIVFEYIFQKETPNELIAEYYELFGDPGKQKDYIEGVVLGVISHLAEIDEKISSFLSNRHISRISKVSLSVLRIAVYEILFTDLANGIAINEAVELAKIYEEPKAAKFVNGVLASVVGEIKE